MHFAESSSLCSYKQHERCRFESILANTKEYRHYYYYLYFSFPTETNLELVQLFSYCKTVPPFLLLLHVKLS